MIKKPLICVMMTTFNGELFLYEQLESIFHQNNVVIDLYIRDDDSQDKTLELLSLYSQKRSHIHIIHGSHAGVTKGFYELIRYCADLPKKYDYYAFADQDDIWLPNKMIKAVQKLSDQSVFDSNNKPKLYYSNLTVVDESLSHPFTMFSKNRIHNTIQYTLATTNCYGCTCVFNYTLLKLMARVSPDEITIPEYVLHDNFIVWLAVLLGKAFYDERSYILHRQHNQNASGQVLRSAALIKSKIQRLHQIKTMYPVHENRAKLFLNKYGSFLSSRKKHYLSLLADYKTVFRYRMILLFTNTISSGEPMKEIARRIRILFNRL